jgi:hypothetical protein
MSDGVSDYYGGNLGRFGGCRKRSNSVEQPEIEERPSSQVKSQVRSAWSACEGLESVVSDLESRLSAVLSPNFGGSKEGREPKQELVPLAHEIENIGDSVSDSIARLLGIISRIEL